MALEVSRKAEDYRWWTEERVRFNDLDLVGHVNNIAYCIYVETGRAGFLGEIGFWVMGATRANVIARTEMDYLREVHFPAQLRIGVSVLALGTRSVTLGIAIFNGDVCVLTALNVIVRFDTELRCSVPLEDSERAMFTPYLRTP